MLKILIPGLVGLGVAIGTLFVAIQPSGQADAMEAPSEEQPQEPVEHPSGSSMIDGLVVPIVQRGYPAAYIVFDAEASFGDPVASENLESVINDLASRFVKANPDFNWSTPDQQIFADAMIELGNARFGKTVFYDLKVEDIDISLRRKPPRD